MVFVGVPPFAICLIDLISWEVQRLMGAFFFALFVAKINSSCALIEAAYYDGDIMPVKELLSEPGAVEAQAREPERLSAMPSRLERHHHGSKAAIGSRWHVSP
jgi:hypothetical protein